MRKPLVTLSSIVAALLVAPAVSSAEPVRGDGEHGGQVFRMECSSCHGTDGGGSDFWKKATAGKNLASVPDLRDSAFLAQRSDADLRKAIRSGMGKNGWIPGHTFASALSTLDTWDVVQFIREGTLTVSQFYPDAAKFTAKDFKIDQWGTQRLSESLKLQLTERELDVVVLTVYRGEREKNANIRLVPWKPVELDLLQAGDRIGFLSFVDLQVPASTETIRAGLSIGTDGKLQKVIVNHADAGKKAEYEKALNAFVGQGSKKVEAFKAPRGLKHGDAWAKALTRAAAITSEGITMYEKSERERTAFDR